MQTYQNLFGKSVKAAAPVAGRTFADYAGATCAAGAAALGVFRNDAAAGDEVAVRCIGTALVISADTFVAGDAVEVGAAGRAIKHVTGTVVGRALGVATVGSIVEIFLINA